MVETNKSLGTVVMVFLVFLLGAIFSGVIGDELVASNTLADVVNESVTLTNVTAVSLANDDWTTKTVIVYNGSTNQTVLADNGTHNNYTVDRTNGRITLEKEANFTTMPAFVIYEYFPPKYVKGINSSRVILALVLIFFVIAVLVIGIGILRPVFESFK